MDIFLWRTALKGYYIAICYFTIFKSPIIITSICWMFIDFKAHTIKTCRLASWSVLYMTLTIWLIYLPTWAILCLSCKKFCSLVQRHQSKLFPHISVKLSSGSSSSKHSILCRASVECPGFEWPGSFVSPSLWFTHKHEEFSLNEVGFFRAEITQPFKSMPFGEALQIV